MPYDFKQFSKAPIPIKVEHEGVEFSFLVRKVSSEKFFENLKTNASPTVNMRRTFRAFLMDSETEEPLTKQELDDLMTDDGAGSLSLKINAAINTALSLDEITAKKG